MTRARPITHRPGCPQTGTHDSRVGGWTLTRCDDCRATGLHRTERADPEED